MLRVILTIVQVFSCFAIIGLVLLQRGKGAEAGAGFGAGASGTVFGARGAGTALSRATAIFVAIFMVNSLLLTYMGTHSATASQPKSILDTAGEKGGDKTSTAPGAAGSNNPAPGVTSTPAPAASGTTSPTPAPATATPAAPAAATAPPPPASTQPAPTPTQGPSPK